LVKLLRKKDAKIQTAENTHQAGLAEPDAMTVNFKRQIR